MFILQGNLFILEGNRLETLDVHLTSPTPNPTPPPSSKPAICIICSHWPSKYFPKCTYLSLVTFWEPKTWFLMNVSWFLKVFKESPWTVFQRFGIPNATKMMSKMHTESIKYQIESHFGTKWTPITHPKRSLGVISCSGSSFWRYFCALKLPRGGSFC